MEVARDAGWSDAYEAFARAEAHAGGAPWPERIGRVSSEHRGGFSVMTTSGERLAQAPASLRRRLEEAGEDKPAVGDWVGYEPVPDGSLVLRAVLARTTRLRRKRPGSERPQVIVANVDRVLVVTSIGRDLNARRVERYLSLVRDGGAEPIVVVSKADLASDEARAAATGEIASLGARLVFVSARSGEGVEDVRAMAGEGKTVAMLGSSGVGKSSLANVLLGDLDALPVGALTGEGKGRHTTTRRSLVRLPSGGMLIDTPGMRELGLWAAEAGVREVFADVEAAIATCRFADCRHEREPDCGVRAALASGALSAARVESYLKLSAELADAGIAAANGPRAAAAKARARAGARAPRGRVRDKDRGRR